MSLRRERTWRYIFMLVETSRTTRAHCVSTIISSSLMLLCADVMGEL